jgi:DNA-binding MarR family transcriptional regulator
MKTANKIDYILQHITSLLSRDSDQILLEQLGIGYSQFKLLRVLSSGAPIKQGFIADLLGQTEASISRQINLLIDKNLITKNVDPHNKRVRLIAITAKGKKITEASDEVLNRYHKNILAEISSKQRLELLKSLEDLHDKICRISHSPDPDYLTYLTEN